MDSNSSQFGLQFREELEPLLEWLFHFQTDRNSVILERQRLEFRLQVFLQADGLLEAGGVGTLQTGLRARYGVSPEFFRLF